MTSQTRCSGSDKQVRKFDADSFDITGPRSYCPECDEIVAIRYTIIRGRKTKSGMKLADSGMWVTLPHDKPFAARCADCGTGLYENDYLCARCRRASLPG